MYIIGIKKSLLIFSTLQQELVPIALASFISALTRQGD